MESVIFITGATSGIGKCTAEFLAANGYSVVLLGRNREKIDELKKKLGKQCLGTYSVNLEEIEMIAPIFDDLRAKQVKLNGLVHCAGVDSSLAPVRLAKNENIERLMRLHVEAFVEMCKCFYKRTVSNDGSSIVAISSLASVMCQKNSLDYSMSKAALNAAVKVTAKEYLKRNIRVNAILPANVDTPMCANLKKLGGIETIQPLGFIEPIYISYMIEFLLSEKASYITGSLFPISAGMEY